MRDWLRGATAVAAVVMAAYALPLRAQALTAEQLYALVSPSIVVVQSWSSRASEGEVSQGSGVVVAPRTVVTNCHVLTGRQEVAVYSAETDHRATLLAVDWRRDVCLLHVGDLAAQPVRLGSAESLRIGQKVYAIGAPEGLVFTLSDGLVSAIREFEYGAVIQTSAPISPGSSGGGLFDDQGTLVGVTTFVWAEGQNLNFAHPADWVRELLRSVGNSTRKSRR